MPSGFDFGQTYGEPDFIEVHHLIPLRDLKPGDKTKLSDLANPDRFDVLGTSRRGAPPTSWQNPE